MKEADDHVYLEAGIEVDWRQAAMAGVQGTHTTAPRGISRGVDAIERYLMYVGPGDGKSVNSMFEDLADLFEQSATDRIPLREIVGEDPVEFVETFARNYSKGNWLDRERERLVSAIDRAEEDHGGTRS